MRFLVSKAQSSQEIWTFFKKRLSLHTEKANVPSHSDLNSAFKDAPGRMIQDSWQKTPTVFLGKLFDYQGSDGEATQRNANRAFIPE